VADETALLRALAGRAAALAVEHARPRAILLTGSVARGEADAFSDVDLILYYDALPDEAAREAIRTALGGDELRELGATETGVVEQYVVEATYCQLAHVTIASWERELEQAVAGEESELPLGKMLSGLFDGEALYGAGLVDEWRSHAVFPDPLRRTLVERSWKFFPLWYFERSFPQRDAPLFTREELVNAAYALLEVLAAVNGVWFSRFQLKRTREATEKLAIAPPRLYERLVVLASGPPDEAVLELESLVGETRELVAEHVPDAEIALTAPLGARQEPRVRPRSAQEA
jgi:predicted nucleotidyltransferase